MANYLSWSFKTDISGVFARFVSLALSLLLFLGTGDSGASHVFFSGLATLDNGGFVRMVVYRWSKQR